jgi:murein DD-endopeptidase MepM/ murein hydrolase activator NlpD
MPRRFVRTRRLTGVIALALALLTAAPASFAASQQTAAEKEAAEEAKLAAVLESFNARLSIVESQLRSLDAERARIEHRLSDVRAALDRSRAALAKKKLQLKAAQLRLIFQRGLLQRSTAQIYIRGPMANLDVRLNAKDRMSLLSVEVYEGAVLHNYIDVLEQIRVERIRIAKLHAEIRKHTIALFAQTRAVTLERNRVARAQESVNSTRNALIGQLVSLGGTIVRGYATGHREIRRIITQGQAGESASNARVVMEWPIQGRVSSPYGPRVHPVFHYRGFHTGLDISSGRAGTPIRAPMAGRVLEVTYLGVYGLTAVVDHGNDIATVYAHMSDVLVHSGQSLEVGDLIGRVGSTGWSTGPHLHFETWLSQKPRNPIYWLR